MTHTTRSAPRILVLGAATEAIVGAIANDVPQATLSACTSYDDLEGTLEAEQPDIALIFKIGRRPFPRETLLRSKSLRWIHNSGAGMDHLIPWDSARLTITNSSGIHGELMGQYVLWSILNHHLAAPLYAERQASRVWQADHVRSVAGATLVIVGFGTIGSEVGRVAKAIGMRVIGVRTQASPSEHADLVVGIDRLHEVLGEADYVSIILPLMAATRGLIDERAIAAIKPGAYFINTGRGGIVNEAALLGALRSGRLSGALLDVFETEPLPAESPLWTAPGTTILPHISGDPVDWRARVTRLFVQNLREWMLERPLVNVVDPARGY